MTAERTPRAKGLARIGAMHIALAALLLVGAASVLLATQIDLVWFRDVGYPDSASILRIGEYTRTGVIYPDPNRPPYLASLYGPLFYILLSFPWRLAHDIDAARLIVRLAVSAFWLASLCVVFLIVFRISGSAKRGAWAVLFACAPDVIAHWTTQIRSDLMGTTFSLLSIYFVLRGARYRDLFAGSICAVLALLCKQSFIAAPVAVLLCLVWLRRSRHALAWGVTVFAGAAVGYGIVIVDEPHAWRELTALSRTFVSFRTGISLGVHGLWNGSVLFALLGVLSTAKKLREKERELVLIVYCVLSWIVALALVMQVGGSTNYFLEPLTASAAVAAITLPSVEKTVSDMSRTVLLPIVLAILCFFFPLLQSNLALIEDSRFRMAHYSAFRSDWTAFTSSIRGRPLFSSYPDITIYSKTPQVADTLLNSILAQRGDWSWDPVIRSLNRADYELVAMYPYFLRGSGEYRGIHYWNQKMFEAILRNYKLAGLCAGMEIWIPRSAGSGSWQYLTSEGCRPDSNR